MAKRRKKHDKAARPSWFAFLARQAAPMGRDQVVGRGSCSLLGSPLDASHACRSSRQDSVPSNEDGRQ